MDNFEWASGYHERFGIHWVNFSDPGRERVPKKSAIMYQKIVADNGFPTNTTGAPSSAPTSNSTSSETTKSIASSITSSITAVILTGIISHFMFFT